MLAQRQGDGFYLRFVRHQRRLLIPGIKPQFAISRFTGTRRYFAISSAGRGPS
jgi:hypothetical protein